MWLLTEINSVISVWDKSLRESLGTENLLPRENNKKTRTISTKERDTFTVTLQEQDELPKFGLDVKPDDATHTPKGYEEVCYSLNEVFWGEQGDSTQFWKWLERTRNGDWLGVFTVVDSISIPAYGLNFTLVTNEECLGLPRCEIKQDTQEIRLKSCQQT